jgi:5'-nucleotidase (lipoprotein e(P4) family)
MRKLTIALCFLLAACTTTQPPAPVAEAASPPCNAGHALVNATLWFQTGAEYRAAALGTYATARRQLDIALADPSWVGAAEESGNDATQPPAVVLDLDETAINNGRYEARVIRQGKTFDNESWARWVDEAAAAAVPGASEFLAYAKSRGVTPFYITNRDHPGESAGTLANLVKLGFPIDPDGNSLLLRGEKPEWTSDKTSRRAHVAASYRVLLVLGDDLNDFASARDKTVAERDAIIDRTASWWGSRWFMLPNPMYGGWERAVTGGTGTPCEQFQKKVDALTP